MAVRCVRPWLLNVLTQVMCDGGAGMAGLGQAAPERPVGLPPPVCVTNSWGVLSPHGDNRVGILAQPLLGSMTWGLSE